MAPRDCPGLLQDAETLDSKIADLNSQPRLKSENTLLIMKRLLLRSSTRVPLHANGALLTDSHVQAAKHSQGDCTQPFLEGQF